MRLRRERPGARWLVATVAFGLCACSPAPTLASVGLADVHATRVYLHALDTFERDVAAETRASASAIEARASTIGEECPAALTYAPRDAAFGEIGEEAIMTTFIAGLAPVRAASLRLAHTIGHLRWGDRRLTYLVRTEASEDRGLATLALPDVCADIAAWKASAYAALPPSSTKFLARAFAIESQSFKGPSGNSREAAIMLLLRRYEGRAERLMAWQVERREARGGRRLTAAGNAARKKLAAGLGVSAL